MLSHEVKCNVLKTTVDLLRAMGPCEPQEIARELLDQCIGIERANAIEARDWAVAFMLERRVIAPYGDTTDPEYYPSYDLHDDMIDGNGRFRIDLMARVEAGIPA